MPEKKPLGITIISGLFTVVGAVTTLILFIEILDSLRIAGFSSILITNQESFFGFLLYGCVPLLFYATGIGLSMMRSWARTSSLVLIPGLIAFLFLNMALNIAKQQSSVYDPGLGDLLTTQGGIFLKFTVVYLILIVPLYLYFKNPKINAYFTNSI